MKLMTNAERLTETTKTTIREFIKDAERGDSKEIRTIDGVKFIVRRRFGKTHCSVDVPALVCSTAHTLRLYAQQIEYASHLLAFAQNVIAQQAA